MWLWGLARQAGNPNAGWELVLSSTGQIFLQGNISSALNFATDWIRLTRIREDNVLSFNRLIVDVRYNYRIPT